MPTALQTLARALKTTFMPIGTAELLEVLSSASFAAPSAVVTVTREETSILQAGTSAVFKRFNSHRAELHFGEFVPHLDITYLVARDA